MSKSNENCFIDSGTAGRGYWNSNCGTDSSVAILIVEQLTRHTRHRKKITSLMTHLLKSERKLSDLHSLSEKKSRISFPGTYSGNLYKFEVGVN
jgi:hypothetical protein